MTNGEQRMATIREVNMANHRVVVEDDYGTFLYVSLHLNDPVITIPVIGERWIIESQGIDWLLEKRAETGSESHLLTQLQPGDRRIEADGNLYLAGQNVYVNGTALMNSDTSPITRIDSDRIVAPMNQYFPETSTTLATGVRRISRFTTSVDFTFSRIRFIVTTGGASTDLVDVGVVDSSFSTVVASGPVNSRTTGGIQEVVVPHTTLLANRAFFVGIAYSGGGTLAIATTSLGTANYSLLLQDTASSVLSDQYALCGLAASGYPFSQPTPLGGYAATSAGPIMALLP